MRRFLTLLLPLLLVFTQQAAAVHALSHHHANSGNAYTQPADQSLPGNNSCDQCFDFAHIAGAAATYIAPAITTAQTFEIALLPSQSILSSRLPARHNRGPPAYL